MSSPAMSHACHAPIAALPGWVREMYAWDIGVAAARSNIRNQGPKETMLIAQPPHDHTLGNATMYHYTWWVDGWVGDQLQIPRLGSLKVYALPQQ